MLIPRPVFGQSPRVLAYRLALSLLLEERWVQLTFCIILAFTVRIATFGDPALHTDEEFYFLVGQKMLDGQLPYVDIWDRKPFGLFLINAGFAAISHSVLSYQIGASLFVALTAFVLMTILRGAVRWPSLYSMAFLYITLLPSMGGFGAQSPVLYNLFTASAALLVARSLPQLRQGHIPIGIYGAMALGGLALTIKQTTMVESAFMGLFAIHLAMKSGLPWRKASAHMIAFAAIGILPFAAFGAYYAALGHFAQYYQAMVESNFAKEALPTQSILANILGMLSTCWLPLILAVGSLATAPKSDLRNILGLWLLGSSIGLCLIPNFYWHYALALVGPMSCCIALLLDRTKIRLLMPVVLAAGALSLVRAESFNFAIHRQSTTNFNKMVQAINAHNPRRTLLVYAGPISLYSASGAAPLSPLVFPWHLRELVEDGASGRGIVEETARILRQRPGAVTFAYNDDQSYQSMQGRAMVRHYAETHCRPLTRQWIFETLHPREITVFGDCR